MSITRIVRAVIVSATLVLTTFSPAQAQWKVFDPINFVKTAITAVETTAGHAKQLDQYALQINQYVTMLQNLERVPAGLINTAIGREIRAAAGGSEDARALAQAGIELSDVYRSNSRTLAQGTQLYQRAANFGQDMNRFSAASGMTWEQILAYEKDKNLAAHGVAVDHYQQAEILRRQMEHYKTVSDAALTQAGSAQGATDALGAVATINGTMVDQLSGLTAAAARREVREVINLSEEAKDKERLRQILEKAQRNDEGFIQIQR